MQDRRCTMGTQKPTKILNFLLGFHTGVTTRFAMEQDYATWHVSTMFVLDRKSSFLECRDYLRKDIHVSSPITMWEIKSSPSCWWQFKNTRPLNILPDPLYKQFVVSGVFRDNVVNSGSIQKWFCRRGCLACHWTLLNMHICLSMSVITTPLCNFSFTYYCKTRQNYRRISAAEDPFERKNIITAH